MKKFKDEQEAKEYVRNWVPSWLCPLLGGTCSTKCVCFRPPTTVLHEQGPLDDNPGVVEHVAHQDVGYCTAYCLVGPD